jgi:5-hydroxyisourate hydrolase-like protein (transthyretin family)
MLIFATVPTPALATGGEISGTVINKTTGLPVGGIEVTLQFLKGQQQQGEKKAITDPLGKFAFSDLTLASDLDYIAYANFEGADYQTKPVKLTTDNPSATVELAVYSSSMDGSKLKIKRYDFQVETGKTPKITEFIEIENTGNTSYAVDNREKKNIIGLILPLPKGFRNVQYLQGLMQCCTTIRNNQMYSTMTIPPGTTMLVYSYEIAGVSTVDLSRSMLFPTNHIFVGSFDQNLKVSSKTLQPQGTQQTERGPVVLFAGANFKKGDQLDLKIAGFPSIGGSAWVKLLLALIGASIAGLVATYVLRRNKPEEVYRSKVVEKGKTISKKPKKKGVNREEFKRAHLEVITRLDELYEAGEISEPVYRKLREEEKEKLAEYL